MLPTSLTIVLASANVANIVASNTPAGAGALSLVTSPWVADVPRRVLVTYGNEVSDRTVLVTGTDRNGSVINETLTVVSGASGSTYTNQDFVTVTAVTVAAAWSAAMSVGTNGIGSTVWKIVTPEVTPVNIGIGVTLVSGSVNYTVEYTYNDPNRLPSNLPSGQSWPTVWPLTALTSQSTSKDSVITIPIMAYRLTVNSGTGTTRMDALQAGVRQ